MRVKELILELQKVDQEAQVFMGYDSNIVVTQPSEVESILGENQIGDCWWSVKPGAVVILCDE